tara:strand:- start:1143 stop:1271 length:129 start_codon:yes stop_codon:yes gene_type:complete
MKWDADKFNEKIVITKKSSIFLIDQNYISYKFTKNKTTKTIA